MFNRLQKKLNIILRKKDIHLASEIFEEAILEIAKIKRTELGLGSGKATIRIDKELSSEHNLVFSFNKIKLSALYKLFVLFGMKPESYYMGDTLSLNEMQLNQVVLPAFTNWLAALSKREIIKYQTRSLAVLAEEACVIIEFLSNRLMARLNLRLETWGELRKKEVTLFQIVTELRHCRLHLKDDPHYYKKMNMFHVELLKLFEKNLQYKYASKLSTCLAAYEKYSRPESVLATTEILSELKTQLIYDRKSFVSSEKTRGYLEDCSLLIVEGDSRIHLMFPNFNLYQMQKTLNFFYTADKTVLLENQGVKKYCVDGDNALTTSTSEAASHPSNAYSISFDSQAFYNNVLPVLKEKIINKNSLTETFTQMMYFDEPDTYIFQFFMPRDYVLNQSFEQKPQPASVAKRVFETAPVVFRRELSFSTTKNVDTLFSRVPTLSDNDESDKIINSSDNATPLR